MHIERLRFLLVSLLFVLVACEGETPEEGEDDEEMSMEPVEIDIDPAEWPVFRFSDIPLPYETSEACLAHAVQTRNDTTEFTTCMCNSCLEKMQECDVLPGCREILECSLNSGCVNEYDCYLLPFAPCTATVDKWGNASVATTVSLEMMDCSSANSCR